MRDTKTPIRKNFSQSFREFQSLLKGFLEKLRAGEEKDYFIENLALLLSSGMGILPVLEALKGEMRGSRMKRVIARIQENVDEGVPLWRALHESRLLPVHVVALVKIGEGSGRLGENLKIVVDEQQKERAFKAKIRSAMAYPILILVLTFVIGMGIAWFILPRLATVFRELALDLPFLTRILIGVGNFLGAYGVFAVPLMILGGLALIYFFFIFPFTKTIGENLIFGLPGMRKLIQEAELARFGYVMGTLLNAGLPVVDALRSLTDVTTFRLYQTLYAYVGESVEAGNSFQKSFVLYPKARKLMPIPIQHMIAAAEQSGRLAETFLKIGEIFESKTEITTKNLTVVLEPILLVIVWLGVVGVALAIILPIYTLIGGLTP